MKYWDKVLEEILNKYDPVHPAFFTNVREYKNSQSPLKTQAVKTHKKAAYPYIPKKHTQLTGANKKYELGEKYPDIYFTKREAQIMVCFMHGMSTAQTAKILALSRRTVEFYINNIKTKLGCRLKFELIHKVMCSDFLKNVDFVLEDLTLTTNTQDISSIC